MLVLLMEGRYEASISILGAERIRYERRLDEELKDIGRSCMATITTIAQETCVQSTPCVQ